MLHHHAAVDVHRGADRSVVDLLTGTEWIIDNEQFGVLPLVSATLAITVGSAVVALPLGVTTAIYLIEYASPRAQQALKPALELLAGVPAVVYGFFAVVSVTPAFRTVVLASLSGIFSSFVLTLSRAIGGTMAVTVAAGSQVDLLTPLNPAAYLEGALPMIAAMVNRLTGDITGGVAYRSRFAVGLTLLLITLVMNIVSDLVAQRYREGY